MNRSLRVGLMACLVLIVCLAASSVFAQGLGCGLGGGSYGLGYFNYGNGQGIDQPRLPYYAIFPPVYYSYPVPRTYGFSPFAYPPGTMTPDVAPAAQASPVIYNPFVPRKDKAVSGPGGDKSASVPRTYLNPFVKPTLAASEAALAGAAR